MKKFKQLESFIRRESENPRNIETTHATVWNYGNGNVKLQLWYEGINTKECIASVETNLSNLPNFWGRKLSGDYESKRIYKPS